VLKPLRVLLIEDHENDALLLLRELHRLGYDVTSERVQTREDLTAALRGRPWDLIISDFRMPVFSAPEALAVCRGEGIEAPFIIVSGTVSEEEAVESMKAGAHDFVTKGRMARLGPSIERGLREIEERQALRAAEARLQQAQKMEASGQLAGGVAHDFNNLLGVIQGYGELLIKDLPREDRRWTRVDHILRAANRGAALTHQLLAFSRQQPLDARLVDLNTVVIDIERMFRRLIGEDIEISTALVEGLCRAKVDPAHIEQVLMNLVINARDAMSGGGRLSIETSEVDLDAAYSRTHPDVRPGPYVMLAVSDTGHGMDAETLSHIFEPFFSTKAPGRGTGLGLATAYGIVRQSGGHIAVYSEPGKGTTFKVFLPRSEEAGAAPVPAPSEGLRTGTETLVLVEDEEALRVVIHDLLEEGGYTVIDGPNPEASLAAAEKHPGPIHMILTDLVMPGINGPEAAARLRSSRAGLKVLYMSGYTGAAAERHVPLEAAHAFIQKPFSLDGLLQKVREVLDSTV
jgi:two-component system, cell cycle sensor histidine kinase and response regulator CckA